MGCYTCGSPEGNEAKLCPACTKIRLEERGSIQPNIQYEEERSPLGTVSLKLGMYGLILGAGLYFVCFSAKGPGFAMSPAEHAYKRCVSKFGDGAKWKLPDDKIGQAFAGALGNMGRELCDGIRKECQNNPNGDKCQQFLRAI